MIWRIWAKAIGQKDGRSGQGLSQPVMGPRPCGSSIYAGFGARAALVATLAACRTRRASNLQLIEFVELFFLTEK